MFWSRVMFHIRETTEETAREACVWDPVNVRQGYLQASGTSVVEAFLKKGPRTSRRVRNIRLAGYMS